MTDASTAIDRLAHSRAAEVVRGAVRGTPAHRVLKAVNGVLVDLAWRRRRVGPPPARHKRRELLRYARSFGLDVLVETGTFEGDTAAAVGRRLRRVETIELSPALAVRAAHRFRRREAITVHQGDSAALLPTVLASLEGPALFWLDAHWSEGRTARGDVDSPVRAELEMVLTNRHRGHVVLIDDARAFVGRDGYPTVEEIRAMAAAADPSLRVDVQDDIIRIHPEAVASDAALVEAARYRSEVERSISFAPAGHDTFTRMKAVELVRLASARVGAPSTLRALDVGCGVGATDTALAGAFAELHGIDIDADAIAVATVGNPDATYAAYDGRSFPYDDDTFDIVFAICVLHHVPLPDRVAFAAELRRVTRPGGLVAVFEHNPLNPLTRLAVSRCPFDEDADLLGPRAVRALLAGAGLQATSGRYLGFLPSAGRVATAVGRVLWPLPLGAQYVVPATR